MVSRHNVSFRERDEDLEEWVEARIEDQTFNHFSHACRLALYELRDQMESGDGIDF